MRWICLSGVLSAGFLLDGQVNVSYHPAEELQRYGLDIDSVQMLKNGSNSFRKIFSTTQFLQMRESTSPYSERGRRDNVVPSL